ncbi:MAG: PQQ-binding-like beta-propeller repeat protein, partial [Pirellulaceae bacterium]
ALDVVSAGGRLFFGSSVDHNLYCVNATTGKFLWTFYTDGPIRLAPTLADGKVYFGSDDGYAYCLAASDGKVVWKMRPSPRDERLLARGRMISRWPLRTGVLVDAGIAYFAAGVIPHENVYLVAVDAATGKTVWINDRISQQDAGRNPLSPQGYLLSSKELLFVPSGGALPAAFRRSDGEEVHQLTHSWRTTAGGVVGGTRAMLADGQIYTAGAEHFLALDQKTGAVGFAWIDGKQLTIAGDKGFVLTGSKLVALDRSKHATATKKRQALKLQQRDLQRNHSDLEPDEYRKQTAALTAQISELGKVGSLWETPTKLASSLVVTGNLLVAGGENQVATYHLETGKHIWQAKVDGDAVGLVVDDGRLYVSTDQGKIYGFEAQRVSPPSQEVAHWPTSYVKNPYPADELTPVYQQAAEAIVKNTGVERGFCLVLGSEEGRLAYELAQRTSLTIYAIESDPQKVARSRKMLDRAGLHGSRITVVQGDPDKLPFSNYFANLVVSDTMLVKGKLPVKTEDWTRCIKPNGGQVALSVPRAAPATEQGVTVKSLQKVLQGAGVEAASSVTTATAAAAPTATVSRGKLPGVGQWSHQYGDPANTSMSRDYRVKGDLGVLWYGDPGPTKMINRHDAASAPLSTNGRMFIQSVDSVEAYDAYNGLFLWEYKNPGALRTGVFNNQDTSNFAASEDAVFIAVEDTCTMLDAATGKVISKFKSPQATDKIPRVWGYVAHWNGMLFGTSTIRKDLQASLRRRGHLVENATDSIFAVDPKTGKEIWRYRGKNVMHVTIAIGDNRVFFIDSSITPEQREELLREDKTALKKLGAEEAKKKEAELKALDVRLAVALDASTGKLLWSEAVDVTDCSGVGIGGGNFTLMYHDGHVVICGANANGHYWRQFLSGQFSQRRLIVLDAISGKKLWAKDANYRHRPIVLEGEIYAEPWAFDLHTGVEKKRPHPVTGEETVWQFSRPGHHCGPLTATPTMLFFRSGFTGYYDLEKDSGTTHFAGHRLGCWVNAIPGNGLLMVPEASAGCVCQFQMTATFVFEPRPDRDTWKLYSATGLQLPVKTMSLNLGAPGDRRDKLGTLWLGFPRPKTVGRLEYTFDIALKFVGPKDYVVVNEKQVEVSGQHAPWV